MNFLSFMVYFRGGELYFSSPLVRSDKEPALPFSGPTLATVTTEEQSPYAWRWEHSACIIYNTLSLVKTGLLFNVNSFMWWGNPSTPSWIFLPNTSAGNSNC